MRGVRLLVFYGLGRVGSFVWWVGCGLVFVWDSYLGVILCYNLVYLLGFMWFCLDFWLALCFDVCWVCYGHDWLLCFDLRFDSLYSVYFDMCSSKICVTDVLLAC